MPSVTVDVDIDLDEFCNTKKLKLVVGYALLARDEKIKDAAKGVNSDLGLCIEIGGEYCPEPPCDRKYREWLSERSATVGTAE